LLVVGCVLMLFVGLAVIFVNALGPSGECGEENATCVTGHQSHVWLGRVYTSAGAPAADATVLFGFGSIGSLVKTRGLVKVVSDREGRYCLRWAADESPTIYATAHTASGPPNPIYVALAKRSGGALIVAPPSDSTEGGFGDHNPTSVGWNAALDATRQCVTSAPPWYRFSNLSSNWRTKLLLWGPLVALLLGVIGGIMWIANRRPGLSVLISSLVLMAGCGALCYLTWFTIPHPV
jgi:hypothetical protein